MPAETEKTVPWCTLLLVLGALICHTGVLLGNLSAADGFRVMGNATHGWANVGKGLAIALHEELEAQMGNITDEMTDAVEKLMTVQDSIDTVLALVGQTADKALLRSSLVAQTPDVTSIASSVPLPGPLPAAVTAQVESAVSEVTGGLQTIIDALEPALMKIGEWEVKFGNKLQAAMEMFSTTIDIVQKLFDGIMAQLTGGGGSDPYMEHNTYTLFALTDVEKGITVQDLKDVAGIYQISALDGSKAEDLHLQYDVNKDAVIDKTEYSSFVLDESLPNIMAVVLRQYSKKLAQVSGQVRGAKLRDEVANAVVHYLQLVCAKNVTKVGWISEVLTNGTLPLPFTAGIMRNLALSVDDPEVLTTTDVGSKVIGTMSTLNPGYTMAAARLMGDAEWWLSEGFDPADQSICVERVTRWTATTLLETGATVAFKQLANLVGLTQSPSIMLNGIAVNDSRDSAQENVEETAARVGHLARQMADRSRSACFAGRESLLHDRYLELRQAPGSRALFDGLLGGALAARGDPKASAAISAGVPAKPETLLFAQWLSANATQTAMEFQGASFNYSGQSSSALDSTATQVQGMVKKTQAFLALLGEYSGQAGITKLRAKVQMFADNGVAEVTKLITAYMSGGVVPAMGGENATENATASFLQVEAATGQTPEDSAATWAQVVSTLEALQSVLPTCISNLKMAKTEVGALSQSLNTVFKTLDNKGKEIFDNFADVYSKLWTVYFVLLMLFTFGVLYYGLWAAGCCGKIRDHTTEAFLPDYEPPQTFSDRMRCCWSSCTHCLVHTTETEYCFWSMLMLGQLFVLVLFLVSVLLVVLAGVNMFISSNCSALYVLGDPTVCSETLALIQEWMTTYAPGGDNIPISEVCVAQDLTVCDTMQNKMLMSATMTAVGAILAAVISFQLLIESAISHERARNVRIIDKIEL